MKILLADDHSMIRNGLKLIIESRLGQTEVSEVGSWHAMMEELSRKHFTHLVLDLNLSDGNTLELIPKIRSLYPDLKIMVFSMQPAEVVGPAMRQYDILYVLSKTAREDQTIRQFLEFLYDKEPTTRISSLKYPTNPFTELTIRELKILSYLLKGNSNSEIATTLNIKRNTVSTLKKRVFEKTKTASFAELKQLAELYKMSG